MHAQRTKLVIMRGQNYKLLLICVFLQAPLYIRDFS